MFDSMLGCSLGVFSKKNHCPPITLGSSDQRPVQARSHLVKTEIML